MTHAVDSTLDVSVQSAREHLPHVPSWVVPRRSLAAKLDRGVSGAVTAVSAPTGWGKTMGVASWAVDVQDPTTLVWLNVVEAAEDPDLFWDSVCRRLGEAGEPHLLPVPPLGSGESQRTHALALLGRSLRSRGRRVLVLDDFPTGGVGALGRDLEVVLEHAQRGLSVVLICRGDPALPLQRHHVAGDLTRITVDDLAMDWREVAGVLAQHDVDAAEMTARTVERQTGGWACGVRLSALALRDAPTIGAALDDAARATVDFMASEVLGRTTRPVHDLLVQTSMVAEVSEELARAVRGPQADIVVTPEEAGNAFVDLAGDGSFRCHPSLRAAAAAELAREPLAVRRRVARRAARWHLDHDQATTGIEIAMAAGDWAWVGRALVEAYVVPQILAGSLPEAVQPALATSSVCATQPLVQAALLMRDGGPSAADAVLALVAEHDAQDGLTDAARLSAVFIRLAVARARGDLDSGELLVTQASALMSHLAPGRRRELATILEAHLGALQVSDGQLAAGELTLRHGAGVQPGEAPVQSASLDCRGQLALLDAFLGNLRAAERQASAVLKSADAGVGSATAHAHLATAWVHIERAENVPARQHLDVATEAGHEGAEPWYRTALLVAEARLLVAEHQPEAALRLLGLGTAAAEREGHPGWSVALLTSTSAYALLATGEPRRALDLVSPGPAPTPVLNKVLAARALVELDELRAAREVVSAVAPDLAKASLSVQVDYWLVEAWLAEECGSADRVRLLVDRALRESEREQLRRPFVAEFAWLLPVLESDAPLRRAHGGFLARLGGPNGQAARGPARTGQIIVETLTVREAQVLGLLAEMCSTEEIARELYLSVNTVKTYVRGILRKLSVNRRVDAVRRGRELGLC